MSQKPFVPKFHEFTSNKFKILIKWIMKKMIGSFSFTDSDMQLSYKIH